MHEPPMQFDGRGDYRPVLAYVVVLAILWLLPWLGVECLFGWCVVQSQDWWSYAAIVALPFLLFLDLPLRLIDRMRGLDEEER